MFWGGLEFSGKLRKGRGAQARVGADSPISTLPLRFHTHLITHCLLHLQTSPFSLPCSSLIQRAPAMARVSPVKTIPRLQPPLTFPGTSRPGFPHPNSFLATQSSAHLCTTQQNGRLTTGEAEGTGSSPSQAQLLSKALSPQDPPPIPQEQTREGSCPSP